VLDGTLILQFLCDRQTLLEERLAGLKKTK